MSSSSGTAFSRALIIDLEEAAEALLVLLVLAHELRCSPPLRGRRLTLTLDARLALRCTASSMLDCAGTSL